MKNALAILALSFAVASGTLATSAPAFAIDEPALYLGANRWLAENADILRAREFQETIHRVADWMPDEMRDPALTKVVKDFGKTVINTNTLPYRSGRGDTLPKVWSAYWYPLYETDLFQAPDGVKSLLERYDLVAADRNSALAGKAVAFEKARYSEAVNRWEGLCDAWSIAAVTMPEPKGWRSVVLTPAKVLVPPPPPPKPVALKPGEKPKPYVAPAPEYKYVERKVSFGPGDLKALLLKTFEAMDSSGLQVYGQRFTGKPHSMLNGLSYGWVQPDLYADQFHRFIEVVVFQRKQSFVMDHDPSEAVWSEPVDGAAIEILPIKGRKDQVLVRTFLFPAKQLRKEDRNAEGKNEHIREYDYILGGNVDWNGNLTVEYGIWLNKNYVVNSPEYRADPELLNNIRVDSRVAHPDFVYTVNEIKYLQRKTANPDINVNTVDLLLQDKL